MKKNYHSQCNWMCRVPYTSWNTRIPR